MEEHVKKEPTAELKQLAWMQLGYETGVLVLLGKHYLDAQDRAWVSLDAFLPTISYTTGTSPTTSKNGNAREAEQYGSRGVSEPGKHASSRVNPKLMKRPSFNSNSKATMT